MLLSIDYQGEAHVIRASNFSASCFSMIKPELQPKFDVHPFRKVLELLEGLTHLLTKIFVPTNSLVKICIPVSLQTCTYPPEFISWATLHLRYVKFERTSFKSLFCRTVEEHGRVFAKRTCKCGLMVWQESNITDLETTETVTIKKKECEL